VRNTVVVNKQLSTEQLVMMIEVLKGEMTALRTYARSLEDRLGIEPCSVRGFISSSVFFLSLIDEIMFCCALFLSEALL